MLGSTRIASLRPVKLLLISQVLIGSYKDIKKLFRSAQQFTILYSCPAHLLHS